MEPYDPWRKYSHLPRDERNRAIEEESRRVSREHEEEQRRAWGPEGRKFEAFGGDYD
jgi:hypothetical protein